MALDRDAYFTPLKDSKRIVKQLLIDEPYLRDYEWVEPSAGAGSFLYAVEDENIKIQGYDIHPMHDDVIENDFLEDDLDLSGKVVIGNPPYGARNRLALDFIDRAFEQGAEYVGFLLLGSFTTYSAISRIQANCEIVAIRKYDVKFENENGGIDKGCFASRTPSSFVLFKKSDRKIKDLKFDEIYFRSEDITKADFSVGFKFYRGKNDLPEISGPAIKKDKYYLKDNKRTKTVCYYNCSNLNEELVKYSSEGKIDGDPTPRTLNFYTKYIHVLKDL